MLADSATRVAIISGAGKGLGRAYAHELASRGVAVVVNNRRHANDGEHSADRVVREIREAGGRAVANYGDAEDPGTGEALLALALEQFGRLDVIIANAGVSEGASFARQDAAQFFDTVNVNLLGTAYLLLPGFRHLYAQSSGHILLSTSAAGLYGEHGLPAYSAAKAGLIGLMHSLAIEGRAHAVRVNAIAPFARTQMTSDSLTADDVDGLAPDEVAPVAAELVDSASTLSGEIIVAGGGRLARAGMQSSAVISDGTDVGAVLQRLAKAPLDREYAGAVAMFQDFLK
ncbi:MAG: SDR family NAD(P)-dependent oxidoreductase [Pseudomonadota bacterium]